MTHFNPNYDFSAYYDQVYERSETVGNAPTECKECDGSGGWSSCCGAPIENGTCTDCLTECKTVTCHVCKGDGEIED